MSKAAITVNHLTKKYDRRIIFEDLTFQLSVGNTMAIIGYSGCGKTTLLRLLGGFEKVTLGEIMMFGGCVKGPSKKAILVGQGQNQLFPWKTAIENVIWPIKAIAGMSSIETKKLACQYLLDLKIAKSDFEKFPNQLSGGMKQRVTIARALALKPRVLLLDEPFGSLDNLTKQKAQDVVMGACKKHNITTVIVTHDIAEAIKMANKILIFCPDGKNKLIKNTDTSEQKIRRLLRI